MVNESSHSFINPDPYSLNTAIVAGSVQDADAACVACADGMKTWEVRVDGLTPDEVTGAVMMGEAGWLDEEPMNLVGGCWVVEDSMEGVRCVAGAAWFIVNGM